MKNIKRLVAPSVEYANSKDDLLVWILRPQERILVLAPHPDDKVLAAGGVIATTRKLHLSAEIKVVIATNGDASYATALIMVLTPLRTKISQTWQSSVNRIV